MSRYSKLLEGIVFHTFGGSPVWKADVARINDISHRTRWFCLLERDKPFELCVTYEEMKEGIRVMPVFGQTTNIALVPFVSLEQRYVMRYTTIDEVMDEIHRVNRCRADLDTMASLVDAPVAPDHRLDPREDGLGPVEDEAVAPSGGHREVAVQVPAQERGGEIGRDVVEQGRVVTVDIRRDAPWEQRLAQRLVANVELPPEQAALAELVPDVRLREVGHQRVHVRLRPAAERDDQRERRALPADARRGGQESDPVQLHVGRRQPGPAMRVRSSGTGSDRRASATGVRTCCTIFSGRCCTSAISLGVRPLRSRAADLRDVDAPFELGGASHAPANHHGRPTTLSRAAARCGSAAGSAGMGAAGRGRIGRQRSRRPGPCGRDCRARQLGVALRLLFQFARTLGRVVVWTTHPARSCGTKVFIVYHSDARSDPPARS